MGFFHLDGLVPAWANAMAYANEGGKIATIPEIIQARLASPTGSYVWNRYFTTMSAEYLGIGADGRLKIIVAHRAGPLSTLEGIKQAYSYSYKSSDRNRRGGRITRKEFLKLEAGEFGKVFVVDYADYVRRFEYPFIESTKAHGFLTDQLAWARLGGMENQKQYREKMVGLNRARLMEIMLPGLDPNNSSQVFQCRTEIQRVRMHQQYTNPTILENRDQSNLPYFAYDKFHPEGELAFAHLLSIGSLGGIQYSEDKYPSIAMEISCHGWNDGTRLLMIPLGAKLDQVIEGPDARELIEKHWQDLMAETTTEFVSNMFTLMKRGNQWFTEYRTKDEIMDSSEPQFVVKSIQPVAEVRKFTTPILGYHGLFKYEISRVREFAPPQANAYCFVGEPEIVWKDGNPELQTCDIQFYRVEVDTGKQVMRAQDLSHNYELTLKLMGY